ncbi:threonine/serine exporter family protein [Vibrio hangzhouensis]|uniref:threonine/serine exporter family protein n=1 Tax=Vibrio hangzhouensis TaxID=462991 RepID=UPI001C947B4F|nr:threonine/serine exporter family protein [Vibrio hangzhouensis]MBY6196382.1 threonine/serine exporter family protein [Vibrio hangzhouensis]
MSRAEIKTLGDSKSEADLDCLARRSNYRDEEIWEILSLVGVCAHKYGSSSMRIEGYLKSLAEHFGYRAQVECSPDQLQVALTKDDYGWRKSECFHVAGDVELHKLSLIGDVVTELEKGGVSPTAAVRHLKAIDRMQPEWDSRLVLFGYFAVAFGLPGIIGGNWLDTLLAPMLSILTFFIVECSSRWNVRLQPWMPFVSTFSVGLLTAVISARLPEINSVIVIVSATAIILPGYSISLGVSELAATKWRSGWVNLSNGMLCMTKMVIGAWASLNLIYPSLALSSAPHSLPSVNEYWFTILFPILMVGLNVVFQVSRRDFLSVTWVAVIAFAVYLMGGQLSGTHLGALLGSLIAVLLASEWSRRTGRPSSVVMVPVVVMLVSGTIGFRGLVNITDGDVTLGLEQFSQTFTVALTIMLGLWIGHRLRKPLMTL